MSSSPNTTILYVEDEESDVVMLRIAPDSIRVQNHLHVARNGEEALNYLQGTGPYADRELHPLPRLVLMDLNVPRVSGLRVLKWIHQESPFADLPVVVYTSSEDPKDAEECRQLRVNDFIVKPTGVDATIAAIRQITERWLA